VYQRCWPCWPCWQCRVWCGACGACGAPESRTPRRWGLGRSFDERNAPRMHGDHTLRSTLSQPAPPALHPYPYPSTHLPAYTERTTRLCAPHPIPPPSAMPARLSPASSRRVIAPSLHRSPPAAYETRMPRYLLYCRMRALQDPPAGPPQHPPTDHLPIVLSEGHDLLQRGCTNGLAKHPSCPSPVPLVSRSRLHVQTPMPIATGSVIPKQPWTLESLILNP
jgi:hypothetical protein